MAYTNTPAISTYQTKPVPFMYEWETREPLNTKDTDAVNVVFESVENMGDQYYEVLKREGTSALGVTLVGELLGVFAPPDVAGSGLAPHLVVVTTLNIYELNCFSNGVWTINKTTAQVSPSGPLKLTFTEFLFDSGVVKLYWYSLQLFQYEYGVGVSIIIPASIVGVAVNTPVFLDGYLFLADQKGNIYNSALNDPTTWPASNFLTAESYPDVITALARVGSYIVAFGSSSVEWFYDAGNPTGSPLSVYTGATKRIGLIGGLVAYGDSLLFVGQPAGGQPELYQIDGLKVSGITTPAYSRFIRSCDNSPGILTWGTVVPIQGHDVYFFGADAFLSAQGPHNPLSYGFDLGNKQITRFTFQQLGFFSPLMSATVRTSIGIFTVITILTNNVSLPSAGTSIVQMRQDLNSDLGVNYTVKFVTRNMDFGTRRWKFGARALLWNDQTPTTSVCNISYSIDDYQTFSTPRAVDISSGYANLPQIGQFQKIAFKLEYTDNLPMRWQQIELDYNQGGM